MDSSWLPTIVALGALAFIWWDIRRSRTMNENKLKKALYEKNGTTVYVPRTECKEDHDNFCKKTEEIKKLIADMDKKRETARKDDSRKWELLQRTLGKIDGYMEAHP